MLAFTVCAVLMSFNIAAGATFGSQPIFAAEWEVAKEVQRIVFPAAPPRPAKGLIVVKIRINTAGAVVSAKTHSGERNLAGVAELAMVGWRYNMFQHAGEPTEVDAYVSVVYEPSESRYYVQGDHCAFFGSPGLEANVHDIQAEVDSSSTLGRLPVPPDSDPTWLRKKADADGVDVGKAIHREAPQYPDSARRAGITGDVLVAVVVNKSGSVVYAAPLDGPTVFLAVSVEAARKWEFKPTTKDNHNVNVVGSLTFHFKH